MAPGIADKKNNSLPLWGNEKTMNLNSLILTNILSSHYFKVNLYQLKTYHEVIDEIYYQVTHLEPWEKGSRKTSGQTGMCGGVRGVGAGGIVSTAFCILYKLFTLKLTRKQVVGLINHTDSPYIRALGFMYIRYTQPPVDLWEWYEPYLSDDEEIDVKAGGGQIMTIGELLKHFLSKLEWFSTLFPRIPVPIQKDLAKKLSDWKSGDKKSRSYNDDDEYGEAEHSLSEDRWDGVSSRSPLHSESKVSSDHQDEFKARSSFCDELAREKERQRGERNRNGSRSHHSVERIKERSGHSSRPRSRSPIDSRSHRDKERRHHRSKHYEEERSEYHKHKHHSESKSSHRKHSHDRKDDRKHYSHSHSHEKKYKERHSSSSRH